MGLTARLGTAAALLALAAPVSGQKTPHHTTLVAPPFAHTLGIHRARPVHLRLFLQDRTTFDDPQGLAAVKFDADDDPAKRGDDYQLTLFGVNSGRGEVIYNSSMQTLAIFGHRGSGVNGFDRPHGITATPDGRVYVADTGNRRIVRLRFDPLQRSLGWLGTWPVGAPHDVAADWRGQVWVTDRSTDAVLRFADSTAGAGTPLLAPSPVEGDRWPLPDDVADPVGLAVGDGLDPWYSPSWYRLYLVDLDGQRLRSYDARGEVLAEITPGDFEVPGESAPGRFFYVALDYYGHVWATDPAAHVVYKMTPDLSPLTAFPGPDAATEPLEEPRGLAIWRRFGQVFVAERHGASYFFVGVDLEVPGDVLVIEESDDGRSFATELFLTEPATVEVTFLSAGRDTLAVADLGVVESGLRSVRWTSGAWTEPPGDDALYARAVEVAVEARPTYSSRKRFSRIVTVPLRWSGRSVTKPQPALDRPGERR